MQNLNYKLGFIGGGVMAEAILSRLLANKIYKPSEIIVSDPLSLRRAYLQENYQVNVTAENQEVALSREAVILAIKPQALENIKPVVLQTNLLISILAGIPIARLIKVFNFVDIIRAMPNTPATVGAGITAITAAHEMDSTFIDLSKKIFASIGQVVQIPENLMDAVTGLSGSGPAYVAILIESLADGGVAAGLPRATALQLAIQTVLGTAQLLQTRDLHPAILKDQVSSPGGTTIAGVKALEQGGFRAATIEAVLASYSRSKELGHK
jgi:pyrroline-5-carboxylate reductase